MNSRWIKHTTSERYSSPIEMRFIDLFMASLGALLFMAMLLAFLLKYLPKETGEHEETIPQSAKFQIVTKNLPSSQVGQQYEVALAYRGGTGIVRWEIVAGLKEIPKGMNFIREQGILKGKPTKKGITRFVVRAFDNSGAIEEQAYELTILPPKPGSKGVEFWLAGIMLFLLLIVWLSVYSNIQETLQLIKNMEDAHRKGETEYAVKTGHGIIEYISLPEGINTYWGRLNGMKKFRKYLGWIILFLSIWFIWRLWTH